MASKVCVYVIAKNESKFVDRFMDSVRDADIVIVGDTGSTDDTIAKFKARGAIVHSIVINPWRFDTARNEVIKLIPAEFDCLFSIDVDETLETAGWKEKILSRWSRGLNRVRYNFAWSLKADGTPDKKFVYDKIHSRDYRWVSPCHEVLQIATGKAEISELIDIDVYHRPDASKSRGSYLGLLEMAVKERPEDDRILHYYGRELFYYGKDEQATVALLKHAGLKNAWAAERAASFRMAAECFIRMGKKEDAHRLYKAGIDVCGYEREPHIEYAKFLLGQSDFESCYKHAKIAMNIKAKKNHYLEDRYAWEEGPFDLAGISAFYIGKKDEAKEFCQKAAAINSGDARLKTNVGFVGGNERVKRVPIADIIIPHHNRHDLLKDCLEKIDRSLFNVIVVSGGSFAENCNRGARAAVTNRLIFLNDDVTPDNEVFSRIVKSDKDICGTAQGGTGGRILYKMSCSFDDCIKRFMVYDVAINGIPNGHCFAITRESWSRLDGFNEKFVNGEEDVDIGLRALEMGMSIGYDDTPLTHRGSQSEGRFWFTKENDNLIEKLWPKDRWDKIAHLFRNHSQPKQISSSVLQNGSITQRCAYRGDISSTQQCKSCGGNVSINIFQCAKHGECSLSRRAIDVTVCPCDDYLKNETP